MMKKVSVIFFVSMLIWIAPDAFAQSKAKDAPAKEAVESIIRPKIQYKADSLSEPFRVAIGRSNVGEETDKAAEVAVPKFTVEGVIRSSNFNQAIINNKVVKIGDVIEGAKVVSIEKAGITLLFYDKQIILPAPAESGTNIPKED
jgi:hypothetical protein